MLVTYLVMKQCYFVPISKLLASPEISFQVFITLCWHYGQWTLRHRNTGHSNKGKEISKGNHMLIHRYAVRTWTYILWEVETWMYWCSTFVLYREHWTWSVRTKYCVNQTARSLHNKTFHNTFLAKSIKKTLPKLQLFRLTSTLSLDVKWWTTQLYSIYFIYFIRDMSRVSESAIFLSLHLKVCKIKLFVTSIFRREDKRKKGKYLKVLQH